MPTPVLIAADVDRTLLERLSADARFAVTVHPARSEEELASLVSDCKVLVTRAHNRVTKRVIDAAPRLKLIAQGTSGTDNIDLGAAAARGIAVVSLPGENANAVAELVIGNMIALTRTVPSYTREMARGVWQRDDCATRHELRHFRLGIVGIGQVGGRVARLARAFGMSVIAYDPYVESELCVPTLAELLRESDIVTLHVPLTAETRRMIDVASLKRGAILINASRGEVLDLDAALAALRDGQLAGLAVDVYEDEPFTRALPDDPRLIATPHIAGCTFEAKASIGGKLYERIVEWLVVSKCVP